MSANEKKPEPEVRAVPMAEWGKDHWSTLAYVESCCVDYSGALDHRRMRCNARRHLGLAQGQHQYEKVYRYPTQLKGGAAEPEHDDWDCFYDLEAAKLVEDIGTGIHPMARLTALGKQLSAQLRRHKMNGGQFATFTPDVTL